MPNTFREFAKFLVFLLLVTLVNGPSQIQMNASARADDPAKGKEQERDPSIADVLVSRIDYSFRSGSAEFAFRELKKDISDSFSNVPEDFDIVLVGLDLQMQGITRNQRIKELDLKKATVAELLTAIASKMNPITSVRDPSEPNQKVVWTVGSNPRDPDQKSKVILITTRSAAKRKSYRLPAAFLPEAERMGRLIIRGTPLELVPELKSDAVTAKADAPKKRDAGWSEIISRETLEDEVKKVKLALDKDVTTPARFSGRGFKSARRHFSELAVLFGIIHEYDMMIRWQNEANDAKQRFSRSAHNCKVGSIQSFNDAKLRLEDLTTLVAGGRLAKAKAVEDRAWGDLVDRSPLMQRMEKVLADDLAKPLADAKEFAKNSDQIRHSSELIAAIANVLGQPSMEEADEADYLAHSRKLLKDARTIVDATRVGDHAAATAALASLQKNCSNCHDEWR